MYFRWTLPIFLGGIKKEMEEQDLYEPLAEHASGESYQIGWSYELHFFFHFTNIVSHRVLYSREKIFDNEFKS